MLSSTVAAILLISPAPTVWKSGNLTIEVNQPTGYWRILDGNSTEVLRAKGIESIAYVLAKKDSLSITGTKSGRRFITDFTTTSENTIKLNTTFFSDRNRYASELLDSFSFPGENVLTYESGGPSPEWATPVSVHYNKQFQIAIWPDFSNFHLSLPMTAFLDQGNIGYKNHTPNNDGAWAPNETPRPVPTKTSFSYYIQAKEPSDSGDVLAEVFTSMWNQSVVKHRAQAFPQQVPFVIAAASTYKFGRSPVGSPFDLNPIPQKEGKKRWITLGQPDEENHGGGEEEEEAGIDLPKNALGFPNDQMDTVSLTASVNAMRAAVAMGSWAKERQQTNWEAFSDQLINLILAGSPENGFATSIVVDRREGADKLKPGMAQNHATPDEAATAFFAVQLLAEFPDHFLAENLSKHILGVLSRIPAGYPSPELAALIASISSHENLPPALRQAAIEHQVQLQATFSVNQDNITNPWTLEALYWLYKVNPSIYKDQINDLVTKFLSLQSLTDNRSQDQLAYFGAFRNQAGEISAENPALASIIGRLGIALGKPEWLDRAAFALRASHSLFETSIGSLTPEIAPLQELGTSSPGFGNVTPNRPDPRINFEGSEGLLNAATWEIMRQARGAYIFAAGELVGFDGISVSPDNTFRNSLLSNPIPFQKAFQDDIKSAKISGSSSSAELLPFPTISKIIAEYRDGDFFLTANPGLSLSNLEVEARGDFFIDGMKHTSRSGQEGFEVKVPNGITPRLIQFIGKAGEFTLDAETMLPEGSPVRWATSSFDNWFRNGDFRLSGTPSIVDGNTTWFSTGDLGNGQEANWMTGEYYTPWLTASGKTLTFTAEGSGECEILLLDEASSTTMETWFPATKSSKVTFDLSTLQGRRVKIVIRDSDEEGLVRITDFKVND